MSAERENPHLPPPPPPILELGSPNCSTVLTKPRSFSRMPHSRRGCLDENELTSCSAAVVESELFLEARNRVWDLESIEGPAKFSFYRHVQPIVQDGPTCGLVALSMASSCTENAISVAALLCEAKGQGFTNHGEMFSVDSMAQLARNVLKQTCPYVEVLHNGLGQDQEYIIHKIATGSILLIPYDADRNHSPCCRRGHKAHWAMVCGVVRSDNSCHLVARQGKSRHLGLWRYEDFQKSNENLVELDPQRDEDGRVYVIPDGGLAVGLCGRAILLHSLGV